MDLLLQAQNESGTVPKALKNRPKLKSHLHEYYKAYSSLRLHRTKSDNGWDPISFESLVSYAKVYGFNSTVEETDRFIMLVQACDFSFLEYAEERRGKEASRIKS